MSLYLFQGIWHLRIFPGGGFELQSCERYSSYRAVMGVGITAHTKSNSNKRRGDNSKVRKPELSFLYATPRLMLFYIST